MSISRQLKTGKNLSDGLLPTHGLCVPIIPKKDTLPNIADYFGMELNIKL